MMVRLGNKDVGVHVYDCRARLQIAILTVLDVQDVQDVQDGPARQATGTLPRRADVQTSQLIHPRLLCADSGAAIKPHQKTQSAAGSNLTSAAPVASTAGGASAAASAGLPAPHTTRAFVPSQRLHTLRDRAWVTLNDFRRSMTAAIIHRARHTILVPQLQLHCHLLAGCAPPLRSCALQHSLRPTCARSTPAPSSTPGLIMAHVCSAYDGKCQHDDCTGPRSWRRTLQRDTATGAASTATCSNEPPSSVSSPAHRSASEYSPAALHTELCRRLRSSVNTSQKHESLTSQCKCSVMSAGETQSPKPVQSNECMGNWL